MSYYQDVYKQRVTKWGSTEKDQHQELSRQYFNDYLLHSANSTSIVFNEVEIPAAIVTNRQDPNKLTYYLFTKFDENIAVASIINWKEEDWIVLQQVDSNYLAYNKYIIVKTNYEIKWLDSYLQEVKTKAFIRGNMDTKVIDGEIVFSNILLNTPNKNLIGIIPQNNLPNGTRILINQQAWKVIDKDSISVSGLMFITLEEDKVSNGDDIKEIGLADAKRDNEYTLELPWSGNVNLAVGDYIYLEPRVYYNGILVKTAAKDFVVTPVNTNISVNGLKITGEKVGDVYFSISLKDSPVLKLNRNMTIVNTTPSEVIEYKLIGDSTIKTGRSRSYSIVEIKNGETRSIEATFSISGTAAIIERFGPDFCVLKAKDGVTGNVTLFAAFNGNTVYKSISIESIWG